MRKYGKSQLKKYCKIQSARPIGVPRGAITKLNQIWLG